MKNRKSIILYSCLMVLYLAAPFLMVYFYSLQNYIGYAHIDWFRAYAFIEAYLINDLYAILFGLLLWMSAKDGREIWLAVFTVVTVGIFIWFYGMLGMFWWSVPAAWMGEGAQRYQIRLMPMQKMGTWVSIVALIFSLHRKFTKKHS